MTGETPSSFSAPKFSQYQEVKKLAVLNECSSDSLDSLEEHLDSDLDSQRPQQHQPALIPRQFTMGGVIRALQAKQIALRPEPMRQYRLLLYLDSLRDFSLLALHRPAAAH